jgi:hypothetical protein
MGNGDRLFFSKFADVKLSERGEIGFYDKRMGEDAKIR